MSICVIIYGSQVHDLSSLKTPFDGRLSSLESESSSKNGDTSRVIVWSSHWHISVHFHFTGEGKLIGTEPLLSIKRNI